MNDAHSSVLPHINNIHHHEPESEPPESHEPESDPESQPPESQLPLSEPESQPESHEPESDPESQPLLSEPLSPHQPPESELLELSPEL